jgi:hypothetical protein
MGLPRELVIFSPRSAPAGIYFLVRDLLSAFLHSYTLKNTLLPEENQVFIQSAEYAAGKEVLNRRLSLIGCYF